MKEILTEYLPENTVTPCFELIKADKIYLKIANERKTKHGDYKQLPDGQHLITIDAAASEYCFLITFIHGVAHLLASEKHDKLVKPHGIEWKYTFQQLTKPFVIPKISPQQLLSVLLRHFLNPMSSSDIDPVLAIALRQYDGGETANFICQLPIGGTFRIEDGRVFRKGQRRMKCCDCVELGTGKEYIFQPHAEVELIRS